jgi:acyl-coenzyme A synthetase/AMP-(fatty) acid ligase
MGEYASADDDHVITAKLRLNGALKRLSIAERRAALVVQCAQELPGAMRASTGDIHLPLSVLQFEEELRSRFGNSHPELVFRTDSTLERARLERDRLQHIPKVVLRQGAPRRSTG